MCLLLYIFFTAKPMVLGTFNIEDTFAVFSDILWLSFDASIYVSFLFELWNDTFERFVPIDLFDS